MSEARRRFFGPFTPEEIAQAAEQARMTRRPFRMPIEDVFNIKGRGTIVVGRVEEGTLWEGSAILIVGYGEPIRTYALRFEIFGRIEQTRAGDNIGILLPKDITRDQILPGTVVIADTKDNRISRYPLNHTQSGKARPMSEHTIPLTPSQLTKDFQALGLQAGQIVMLHASSKAVGDVMGGPNTILQSLLDVLTPAGTLMMYAGWNDIPDYHDPLPDDTQLRQIYYEQYPAFDPAIARSTRWNGVLVEFLRTWPGAQRSLNPEVSMVAVGAQAVEITQDHPINYGYGAGSPLSKLAALGGSVLVLGSPLSRITLLHYAEYCANLRHKSVIHYQCPILQDGQKVWVDVEDYNTGDPHDDYTFEQIAHAYLDQGKGQRGTIGNAESYLFDAADLTRFAIEWLETRFGT